MSPHRGSVPSMQTDTRFRPRRTVPPLRNRQEIIAAPPPAQVGAHGLPDALRISQHGQTARNPRWVRSMFLYGGLFKGSDYSRENAAHYRRAYMNRGSILERIWVLNPTSENRALRCIIPRDFPGMRSWSCAR